MYLFILASHNSGSTALWEILKTSPHVTALPSEGQHIPEIRDAMRQAPWNPAHEIPWETVRAAWEPYWDSSKRIRLEKSPPNLLRAAAIEQHFGDAHFIVMVRNPYAYCEGVKRRGRNGIGYSRTAGYSQIAAGWLAEGRIQLENLARLSHVMALSFEEFTDDPAASARKILDFLPPLEMLDVQATISLHSLHGQMERQVTNLNDNQIARLTAADLTEINQALRGGQDTLHALGYSLLERRPDRWTATRLALTNALQTYVVRTTQRIARRLGLRSRQGPAK